MFEFFSPIIFVVSHILYFIHGALVTIGFSKGPSIAWVLSIVLLTVLVRVCILPLFLKTLSSNRKLQAIQPEMKAIQNKYKNKKDQASREAMAKETMALYQQAGANPFGSCLPLLIQSPFFISIWQLLSHIKPLSEGQVDGIGPIDQQIASDIENSNFLGVNLSASFQTVSSLNDQVVIILLVAVMCIGMFVSQRMVMLKNMPIASKEGTQFNVQKSMIYIFPLMYIFSGAMFPVGLLLYMVTTNLWTLGQGVWQLEFMPTPGSEAAEKKERKQKAKEEKAKEELAVTDPDKYEELYGVPDELKTQREQPSRKKRRKND